MTAELDYDKHWTVDDYMKMDEDQRYEIIGGKLWMTPAPNNAHQRIITRLGTFIDMHVLQNDLGECRHTPFDVFLADDTVVQPDFTYVSKERVDEVLSKRGAEGAPDLVIEVLSKSTAQRDRLTKRTLYANAGVRWFVLVDPNEQVIETFELNDAADYVFRGGAGTEGEWEPPFFEGLSIELDKVWP
jgi:Uma2 family endonuclease